MACGAELVSVDKMICQSSSRMNGALLQDSDMARFQSEAEQLGDLVTDEGASSEIAGPALAVHLSAPTADDGDEAFTRALDSLQVLNNACLESGL